MPELNSPEQIIIAPIEREARGDVAALVPDRLPACERSRWSPRRALRTSVTVDILIAAGVLDRWF
jgi:hypothetical protein